MDYRDFMSNIVSASQSKVRSFVPSWLGSGWGIVGTLAILYTVINMVWTYFHWGGPQYVSLITNLLSMPPALLAALIAWYAATRPAFTPRLRRAWALLGVGFFMAFMGNIIWAYLELVLLIEPFPSIADIFYLGFYPFVLWGILTFPSASQNRRERLTLLLDLLSVMIAATMLIGYFIR